MGFLLDQNTRTEGEYVPFFGRPAFTPTTPAALALRTGAPVIFCWHHRRSQSHQLTVERIDYEKTGDQRRDILALTTLLTARLEKVIRAAPEQWGIAEQSGSARREVDFYDVKSVVEAHLAGRQTRFEAAPHPAVHPGRSARVTCGDAPVGWMGELHPRWQRKYGLPLAPVLFELELDPVSLSLLASARYELER